MKSMTGYGAASGKVGKGRLYLEVKSVNHRYCDIAFKIPARLGAMEGAFRELLQTRLERGRIEVFARELEPVFGEAELVLNVALARQYQTIAKRLQKELQLPRPFDWLSVVGLTPFVHQREKEGNLLVFWREIEKIFFKALEQLERMRAKEGAFLLRDQKQRLHSLTGYLHKIEVHLKAKSKGGQKKPRQVLAIPAAAGHGFNGSVDKSDITEEVIRLKSHAAQYARLFAAREPVGRKLDFLIQEMHREVNTMGAKAADVIISKYIVESKSLLENLREQVQNVI